MIIQTMIAWRAQQKLIALLALGIVITFTALAWIEKEQRTPQGWWALSFVHIHGESVDFMIDNYTTNDSFTYMLTTQNDAGQELSASKEEVSVPPGTTKTIPLKRERIATQKITITVESDDGSEKVIWK